MSKSKFQRDIEKHQKFLERLYDWYTNDQCKFHDDCKLYREDSGTCNKTGGMYSFSIFDLSSKPAGCYKKCQDAQR